MNNQDLRVLKTEKNIKTSFLTLLQKENFSTITIQNILDKAFINRSTFYRHYADKFDLANQINQDLLVKLKGLLDVRYHQSASVDTTIRLVNQQFKDFFELRDTFLTMVSIQHEEVHLREDILKLFSNHYLENFNQEELEAQLFASIIFTTLLYSLTNSQVLELETIKKSMLQLMANFQHIK